MTTVLRIADTLGVILREASKATPIGGGIVSGGGVCEMAAVKLAADLHQHPVTAHEELCGDVKRTGDTLMDYWR